MKVHEHIFEHAIMPEHLFAAWEEFKKGKTSRADVQAFEWKLEENIFQLHHDLLNGTYRHGSYHAFRICDPKQRQIHKATVRDRIVHHAVFKTLNPIFEPTFIAHSFSCRIGKGTHRGVDALETMLRKVRRNHTRSCFALKCDIHKFFASVDHPILLQILAKRVKDERMMRLLRDIIESFPSGGIPIGNLTSQLFANVYMNEFDQFMEHHLKIKHYIRYTDDFIIVSNDEEYLQNLLPLFDSFLYDHLHLLLHPHKVSIRKYSQGIDFLGYVVLPHHRMLRTKTKRRMIRRLEEKEKACDAGIIDRSSLEQSLQSYLGVLSHANTVRLGQVLQNRYWF